jgi:two-component system response regulator protein BraR/BceR
MYRIMIVEDEQTIAKIMQNRLEMWDYTVLCVQDFKDVIGQFTEFDPQLVLMDISLPYFSGYHWCSEIRRRSKVPIIFVSSASDNMNMVMAMNMGADDFIAKPFDLNVFVAKIQAWMRRAYAYVGQTNLIEFEGAILNLTDATLSYNDQKIDLTKNDFKTMQILLENPGEVISRSAIMTRLWESDSFIDDNTLTVNIARLRKKLEEIGLTDFILTKKGIGYSVHGGARE